jgi:hypothetical protein
MPQPNILARGLLLRQVRRIRSCAQKAMVLAVACSGEAAADDYLTATASPPRATSGIEATTPALATAAAVETRPAGTGLTLDERQRHVLLLLMLNAVAQQPRFGTMGR